jgi:hypothetical protein
VPTRTEDESLSPDRIRYWPDLAFWYGLGFDELRGMPNALRAVYEDALARLKAEHTAILLDATCFPNMKQGEQRSMSLRLERTIRRGLPTERAATPSSPEEYARDAAAMGIGVKFVPPKEKKAS